MRPFTKTPIFSAPALSLRWLADLIKTLMATFRDISEMPLNKSSQVSVADTGTADTEFTVSHYLGRIPEGYLLTCTDKAASVYESGTAWTATTIYLKCSAANAKIDLLVF